MSSSAINAQLFQAKIGSIQNQADSSSVYSAGVWSFKNSTALTSVTITDAGNVGIGTASPATKLDVNGGAQITGSASGYSGGEMLLGATGASLDSAISTQASGSPAMFFDHRGTGNTGYFVWRVGTGGGAERMRIDASGRLLVGSASSNFGTLAITANAGNIGNATNAALWINTTSSSYKFAQFEVNGFPVGSITTNGSSTAYNTSSDYRLKKDVQPISAALSKVAALKPCVYKWKVDGSEGEGFIAHELAEVCPLAVTGEKDAVNEDGSINSQGIDPSKIVALLTAAIQELSAKVDAQAAEIEALKAK